MAGIRDPTILRTLRTTPRTAPTINRATAASGRATMEVAAMEHTAATVVATATDGPMRLVVLANSSTSASDVVSPLDCRTGWALVSAQDWAYPLDNHCVLDRAH